MSPRHLSIQRQWGHGACRWSAWLALAWALLGALPTDAAAAITYVGVRSTTTVATASSLTLNGPVGLTTGDVMIATVSQAGATVNWTAPAGWTTLLTSDGTRAPRVVVWYRVATAADTASTSYTFTSSASAERGGGIMAFRGVDNSAPIAASAIQAKASAKNMATPSITPGVANSMLVAIWGFGDSNATVPAAMTASIPHGSSSANVNLMSAYEAVAASTATGTRTLTTADSVAGNAALLALKPAGRAYYMYFNAGTALTQPPVTTNTTCPTSGDTNLNGVPGITLLKDVKDASCVPANNRDVIWNSASPSLSLYYNGAGYASAMDVTGISVGIRARSVSASATLTVKLFYTKSDNSKVYFSGTPATQAVTSTRTDYSISLAGLSASSVPAGSNIGIEFTWSDAGGMRLSVNESANNDKLIVNETAASAAAVDHYELSLPTTSITCLPTTVTVTACATSGTPCSSAAGSVSGQTATLATGGATLGATTLGFDASGIATTTLSYPAAGNGSAVTVTLSGESAAATSARQCCPNGGACSVANSCSTTFNSAGFIVSAVAGGAVATLPTQTAGTASGSYVLRAVQTGTTTAACVAALTGANTVNWAYECNNPGTCSAGNLMNVDAGTPTTIQRNNNAGVVGYTPVSMSFDAGGNAPFTFTFSDVGQTTLWASKTLNSATLSGASNAFVTRPAGFTIAGIAQTASPNLANPAAASAAGARFVKAGEGFSATLTARTSGGAATPNYGQESSPEGVLLTRTLVLPGGGAGGTLSNATVAGGSFAGGVATVTNLAWSEVGIITLTPSVGDGSYLGVGDVTGTTTGNIGRFFPAQFALSAGSVTQRAAAGCSPASGFTYLGENFQLAFTLTAQSLSGATTVNYQAAFAKLDPATAGNWQLAGIDGSTLFSTGGAARLSLGSAAGSWSNGVAAGITLSAAALRAAVPDGPFNAVFGIAPSDSDGVLMAAYDLDTDSPANGNDRATVGTVPLRFGRLRLGNAVGAQTRALALPLTAQYWTGITFDTNPLDNCTTLASTAVSIGNLRKTLTAADTVLTAPSLNLNAGVARLTLAAPSGGRHGSADVVLSLGASPTDNSCLQTWAPPTAATTGANLAFLRGAWCGAAYDKDPSARASWGLYRGADAVLYQRENY